jgi:hypothetical protein
MVGVQTIATVNYQCPERVRSNRSQKFFLARLLEVIRQIHDVYSIKVIAPWYQWQLRSIGARSARPGAAVRDRRGNLP